MIGKLDKVQSDFNKGRTGAAQVSLADVIVIAGRAAPSFPGDIFQIHITFIEPKSFTS